MQSILNAIQKEIDFQLQNAETTSYGKIVEFEYGTLTIDIDIDERTETISEPNHTETIRRCRVEVIDLNVTNEDGDILKEESEKAFNELEQFYTNY